MKERKITLGEIEDIVRNPDWSAHQGPKWILAKHFDHRNDNKLAAVVIEKEEAKLWVVLTLMIHFESKR